MCLGQNWKLHSGAAVADWRVHLRNIEGNSMASQLPAPPLPHALAQPGVPHPQAHPTPLSCRLEEHTQSLLSPHPSWQREQAPGALLVLQG